MTEMFYDPVVECHYCGGQEYASKCKPETIEIATGRSSGSATYSVGAGIFNLDNKKGKRNSGRVSYNTGRTYYKRVKVYKCQNCIDREAAILERNGATGVMTVLWGIVLWYTYQTCYFMYYHTPGEVWDKLVSFF